MRHVGFRRHPVFVQIIALLAFTCASGSPGVAQVLASLATGTSFRQAGAFVENRGQWDGDFAYRALVGAMTVYVRPSGWTFVVAQARTRGVAVSMEWSGLARELVPQDRLPGVHHYFLGSDPTRWRADVPLHARVRLVDAWPQVDVVTRVEGGHFEYDLLVSPGVDLAELAIEVRGAKRLGIDDAGSLVIDTVLGQVRQPVPVTWQLRSDGTREAIRCGYTLLDAHRFGFSAPAWDGDRPLVIDPGLIFSSHLGGGAQDEANAVALDASGDATIAGTTLSINFPTTLGAFDLLWNGSSDAFVARLSASGSTLLYATYLGGSMIDEARGVAVDAAGAATVTGRTFSANFPTTAGAFDTTHNGGTDVFLTRLSPGGGSLVGSTFVGGTLADEASAVALDATGAATVGGLSTSGDFPATPGAFDTTYNTNQDGFVIRVSADVGSLVYATYLGGTDYEFVNSVALEASGAATVTGRTASSDFPTTAGAFDTTWNTGLVDAFVTRISPAGDTLVCSTFLGGVNNEDGRAVAVDPSGAAAVAGYASPGGPMGGGFPVTGGAFDTSHNGGFDVFVMRLNASGSAQIYSTFLGGGLNEQANAIAVDAAGIVTVAGQTQSMDFPTTPGAYDTTANGPLFTDDAFVARFSADGSVLAYSTYVGGGQIDEARAIAVDAAGIAMVVGKTQSVNFPTTVGALAPGFIGGISDAFVLRLAFGAYPFPLMAFPDVRSVPVGGIFGLEVIGPPGAPVAILVHSIPANLPLPPFGALGVAFPPLLVFDGIGLGLPVSLPMALAIGPAGVLDFSYAPVPASLVGATYYVQAVAVSGALPGGAALSTHGNLALLTPACQASIVP
jgi:hypothetical protein